MKLVYIEWVDATTSDGWEKFDIHQHGIDYCKSVGWLLHEDKQQIVMASTVSDNQTNQRIAIPKAWIKKRRSLKI